MSGQRIDYGIGIGSRSNGFLHMGVAVIQYYLNIRNSRITVIDYPDTKPGIVIWQDFITAFYFDVGHFSPWTHNMIKRINYFIVIAFTISSPLLFLF